MRHEADLNAQYGMDESPLLGKQHFASNQLQQRWQQQQADLRSSMIETGSQQRFRRNFPSNYMSHAAMSSSTSMYTESVSPYSSEWQGRLQNAPSYSWRQMGQRNPQQDHLSQAQLQQLRLRRQQQIRERQMQQQEYHRQTEQKYKTQIPALESYLHNAGGGIDLKFVPRMKTSPSEYKNYGRVETNIGTKAAPGLSLDALDPTNVINRVKPERKISLPSMRKESMSIDEIRI